MKMLLPQGTENSRENDCLGLNCNGLFFFLNFMTECSLSFIAFL